MVSAKKQFTYSKLHFLDHPYGSHVKYFVISYSKSILFQKNMFLIFFFFRLYDFLSSSSGSQ